MLDLSPALQPGDPAPDFTLPAIHREGTVSLADYKGRSALLLALFRGLYCPFCRRGISQLALGADRLAAAGVETLAVVATQRERARLYFRYRPSGRLALASDPELTTLKAFRVPRPELTPQLMEAMQAVQTDVRGELAAPLPMMEALNALDEKDRFEWTPTDQAEHERQGPILLGQFLVDRGGIIRWANVEGARHGLADMASFPADDEFLAAARFLSPGLASAP
jgi:peroxiredoxin